MRNPYLTNGRVVYDKQIVNDVTIGRLCLVVDSPYAVRPLVGLFVHSNAHNQGHKGQGANQDPDNPLTYGDRAPNNAKDGAS